MKRQNPVFYSNKPERKIYVDYSPKMQAKKIQSIKSNRFDLKAQASAYMRHRNPEMKAQRLGSPPQYQHQRPTLKKINQQRHILNEDQIRNSALYRILEEQIKQLTKRQEQQLHKLRKTKEGKKKELQTVNKQQYGVQLQIWELRNEVTDLKDSIDQEKKQTERLNQQLGINEEEELEEDLQEQEGQGNLLGEQQQEVEQSEKLQIQQGQLNLGQHNPQQAEDTKTIYEHQHIINQNNDDNQRESNSEDDSSS